MSQGGRSTVKKVPLSSSHQVYKHSHAQGTKVRKQHWESRGWRRWWVTVVMGRPPCCDKVGIKKGPWTPEEDIILVSYIQEHGPGNWRSVPTNTGTTQPKPKTQNKKFMSIWNSDCYPLWADEKTPNYIWVFSFLFLYFSCWCVMIQASWTHDSEGKQTNWLLVKWILFWFSAWNVLNQIRLLIHQFHFSFWVWRINEVQQKLQAEMD